MNTSNEKAKLEAIKERILSAQDLYLGSEKKTEDIDLGLLSSQNNPNSELKEDLDDATKQRFTRGNFQPSSNISIDSDIERFEEELRTSRRK